MPARALFLKVSPQSIGQQPGRGNRPGAAHPEHRNINTPDETGDADDFPFRQGQPDFLKLGEIELRSALQLARAVFDGEIVEFAVGWFKQGTLAEEIQGNDFNSHRSW